MVRAASGLKSEMLRSALDEALAGRPATLERLLCRHGGLPGTRPNLKLAAAFGAELAQHGAVAERLLEQLTDDDSPLESPRVFLPIAAAHGWAERLRKGDARAAWSGLQRLAADQRALVRVGTLDALRQACAAEGGADALVEQARAWLEDEEADRELAYGSTALALDALSEARVLALVRAPEPLFGLLTFVIDRLDAAPRSASRSDARRRLVSALANIAAHAVAGVRAGERGAEWFRGECERATHPDVRGALSQALQQLPQLGQAPARGVIDGLRSALQTSAKPLRDAARVRPGAGRGRRSRPLR
jgi:hypothetical protein